jgi:hypothetical protein
VSAERLREVSQLLFSDDPIEQGFEAPNQYTSLYVFDGENTIAVNVAWPDAGLDQEHAMFQTDIRYYH